MGRAALQPSVFFKDKLPAHKKPISNRTSSPTDFAADVPKQRLPQERNCHTKTLQEFSRVSGNSNTGEAPVAHTFSKGFSASKMNPSNLSK